MQRFAASGARFLLVNFPLCSSIELGLLVLDRKYLWHKTKNLRNEVKSAALVVPFETFVFLHNDIQYSNKKHVILSVRVI